MNPYQWYGTYLLMSPTLVPRLLSELAHAVGGYGSHSGGVAKHIVVTQIYKLVCLHISWGPLSTGGPNGLNDPQSDHW